MPVKFACSCGTQLRVADEDAGRRIKCPKCGDIVTSPSAPSPKRDEEDDEERPVRRRRNADEEGIQRSPRRRPTPATTEDEDERPARRGVDRDEDDRPARRSRDRDDDDRDPDRDDDDRDQPGRRKKKRPRKEKKAIWPIVLILTLGGLLLFGGGGFGVWYLFLRGGPVSDLAYIPPDAKGFMTVRMADVWKLDTMQKLVRFLAMQAQGNDPISELQRNIGLAAADIERLSFVIQDFEPSVGWMVVLTTKPYDRKAILANLGNNVKEVKHEGRTYHLGKIESADGAGMPAPPGMGPPGIFGGAAERFRESAVYFASPRVMIFSDDNGMQRCLAAVARKNATGSLTDAIQQAGGKLYLFSTFTVNPAAQQKMNAAGMFFPPALKALGLMSLLEFTGGTIVSNTVGDPGFLDFKLAYGGPDKAAKAKKGLVMLKEWGQREMPPLKPLLDGTTIDASGNDVKVRITLDSKTLEGLLPDMGGAPPQFDPPPGGNRGGKGRPKK
jgi:hypothetical protein